MAKKLMMLDEGDIDILQRIIDNVRNSRVNSSAKFPSELDLNLTQAPDLYVAKVKSPATSIPALTAASPYDKPGSAECDIYRIGFTTDATPIAELRELDDVSKIVYNVTAAAVTGWFLVIRDKFGQWYTAKGSL